MKNQHIEVLNLGSGKDVIEEAINLDIVPLEGVDVVWDINKSPWPFEDNTFETIICNHILEHTDNLVKVVEEIHRVGKPEGLVKIRSPYFVSPVYYQDPTHKQKFNYDTFRYFSNDAEFSYYSGARFEVVKRRLLFLSTNAKFLSSFYSWPVDVLINCLPHIYQRFFCYILPCSEIHYLLKIEKSK